MKNLLYILFILPLFAFSQTDSTQFDFPIKGDKIVYESIIENSSLSKSVLYGASKKWIADTFKSSKSVIQSEDLNSGQIIAKFYNQLGIYKTEKSIMGRKFDTQCSIQIDVKEGKSRIRLYDISWVYPSLEMQMSIIPLEDFLNDSPKKSDIKWFGIKEKQKVDSQYTSIIDSFKKAILSAQNDDF